MTAQTPIVNAGLKYVNGLGVATVGSQLLSIAAGSCRDSTNTNDIVLQAPIVLDGSIVGANGSDGIPLGLNDTYAVYLIGDSTGYHPVAGIFSLSLVRPNLPSGYDMFRRISWAFTRPAGPVTIEPMWQYGNGDVRPYYFQVKEGILVGGANSSFTQVPLTFIVPPIRSQIFVMASFTPTGATSLAEFIPYSVSPPAAGIVQLHASDVAQLVPIEIPTEIFVDGGGVLRSAIMYRVLNGGSLTLSVSGFVDYLD